MYFFQILFIIIVFFILYLIKVNAKPKKIYEKYPMKYQIGFDEFKNRNQEIVRKIARDLKGNSCEIGPYSVSDCFSQYSFAELGYDRLNKRKLRLFARLLKQNMEILYPNMRWYLEEVGSYIRLWTEDNKPQNLKQF